MNKLVEELDALAPLAATATEGPWRAELDFESDTPMVLSGFGKVANVEDINFGNEFGEDELNPDQPEDNAAFIAAARNFLTPANIAAFRAALSPAPVATQGAGQTDGWVPVTAFEQIEDGDSLLIHGAINLEKQHLFHNIQKKGSEFDGQEVILRRKGNIYFNFDRFLAGNSWVEACYRLVLPQPQKGGQPLA